MTDSTGSATAPRSRFLWGILLAWIPFVAIIAPTLREVFRGVSSQKAVGLGAVAGGFSEALVTFGFLAFVTAQVLAIVFLVRSMGVGGIVQNIFSIVTVALSVVTLVATGLILWMILFVIPRLHSQ